MLVCTSVQRPEFQLTAAAESDSSDTERDLKRQRTSSPKLVAAENDDATQKQCVHRPVQSVLP